VSSEVEIAAPGIGLPEEQQAEEERGLWGRAYDNIRTGNLGILPIVIGLALIIVFFSFKATNFFTADNFNNIIVQMAGLTMLAFGVVFVLLSVRSTSRSAISAGSRPSPWPSSSFRAAATRIPVSSRS